MGVALDLTGKVFGRLTVLELMPERNKHRRRMWSCSCSCGKTTVVATNALTLEHTKSCGCLYLESLERLNSSFSDKYKTHGKAGTPEHKAWKRVKARACNPNNEDYPVYSLLGMQEEWKTDFTLFLSVIGEMPKDGQRWSVGRIDNTVGYYEGNVRWEIDSQQAKNKGKYKNNSTGETGVYWRVTRDRNGTEKTSAVATWRDAEGKPRSKGFSVNKYGVMEAFAMAVKERREQFQKLKDAGMPYGEHHGK